VHVLSLAEVIFDENAWEHLVLDADSKTLIKSLVEVTQVTRASQALINDVISGKGGGLCSWRASKFASEISKSCKTRSSGKTVN